ncbi:MAG: glycosyltransferase family 4 protein [Syntrophobacterales bacterium]|jgi:glycosyltransferase involved in cell wall biosynthesis|nr:glycosyltransferase family 4 protein [Syntrophobacterales bacterium]
MNILIIANHFWPENFPINILARGLHDRGHQVTVLTGIPNYPAGKFYPGYGIFQRLVDDYQGIKIFHVPLIPRGSGSTLRLILNYLSYALCAGFLAPLWCRGAIDLILVYETSPVTVGIPAMVLKRLRNIPIMFWVQDLWPESLSATGAVTSGLVLGLTGLLVGLIYRYSDLILAQSRAFFPSIEKHGGAAEKLVYFPNSAADFYRPVAVEAGAAERTLLPRGFRLIFAGNIGAAQDFDTILSAAELLKDHQDLHWIILGDGRRRAWVEEQVRARGLTGTVRLLGRYPAEAMPRFFALADAMLVTLKKEPIFALTIPAKVQSYLACGRPIVAALDGEGSRVVQEAGAGLAGPAGDPQALAKNVLAMYRLSKPQRQAMGVRSRDYFEAHFERRMLLDRIEGLMQQVKKGNDNFFRAGNWHCGF